jgi:hypothetical protein
MDSDIAKPQYQRTPNGTDKDIFVVPISQMARREIALRARSSSDCNVRYSDIFLATPKSLLG